MNENTNEIIQEEQQEKSATEVENYTGLVFSDKLNTSSNYYYNDFIDDVVKEFKTFCESGEHFIIKITNYHTPTIIGFNRKSGEKENIVFCDTVKSYINGKKVYCGYTDMNSMLGIIARCTRDEVNKTTNYEIDLMKIYKKVNNLEEFITEYNKEFEYMKKYSILKLYKISNPLIYRETSNNKENTFDFIRIECNMIISSMSREEKINHIKRYRKEIDKMVIEKIKNFDSFNKYNVPINCLKLYKCTLTSSDILVYQFELKTV